MKKLFFSLTQIIILSLTLISCGSTTLSGEWECTGVKIENKKANEVDDITKKMMEISAEYSVTFSGKQFVLNFRGNNSNVYYKGDYTLDGSTMVQTNRFISINDTANWKDISNAEGIQKELTYKIEKITDTEITWKYYEKQLKANLVYTHKKK